jgi:hypothetical protein
MVSFRFLNGFVRDFFTQSKNFSSSKQERVTQTMFFAFLLKVELISGDQFLRFCRQLLVAAVDAMAEEEKLFVIGLIAHSMESCSDQLVRNFDLLAFVLEYSLFILEREYVNMMLELQIIDVISKVAPEINFLGLVKRRSDFQKLLKEAQGLRRESGEAKAYRWLQERLQKERVMAQPEAPATNPQTKTEVQKSVFQEPEVLEPEPPAPKEDEEKPKEEQEEPEDPAERYRLKNQFDAELEHLMAEGGATQDQSQKKNVIFKQMKLEPTTEGVRLIVKNQKSRLVSRALEIAPIFDKKSSSYKG